MQGGSTTQLASGAAYLTFATNIRSITTVLTPTIMARSKFRVSAATSRVARAAPASAGPVLNTVGATTATITDPGIYPNQAFNRLELGARLITHNPLSRVKYVTNAIPAIVSNACRLVCISDHSCYAACQSPRRMYHLPGSQ
jgi:hypothetical protein